MNETKTNGDASLAAARQEVERSRARISGTLDEIEDRIVEKRERLRQRFAIVDRVKDRIERAPLGAVGAAVGVGLLIGMLGGGSDDDEDLDEDDRAELRALLEQARETGVPLHGAVRVKGGHPSFWQEVRAQLVGAVTATLVAAITERAQQSRRREERAELED